MNAVKGTNRLILDDMRWYLMLFSLITLMLTAVYLAVGFIFDVAFTTQLFGPMYGESVHLPWQASLRCTPLQLDWGAPGFSF